MKSGFLLLLLLLTFATQAQVSDTAKLIGLHPAVGKVIDRDEKMKYRLFPDYDDRLFEKAELYSMNDTAYLLVITSVSGTKMKYHVNEVLMDKLYEQVDAIDRKQYKDWDYASNAREHPAPEPSGYRTGRQREYATRAVVNLVILTLSLASWIKL